MGRIRARGSSHDRLLLVFDQFEELFTLCPEPDLRRRFLDGLLACTSDPREEDNQPLSILITLRADFMGQALAIDRWPTHSRGQPCCWVR